ncbi:neutral zinc metallopeptidase [Actinopolymorpha alba]|uniref:neutral zinc metallopeptidase n=1 Tax=Actinopolymorpha alba TaxID=533267 RepID=UPI00037A0509|nr:neutral zinc metallopeptidase [Actinopolymorpha alba]
MSYDYGGWPSGSYHARMRRRRQRRGPGLFARLVRVVVFLSLLGFVASILQNQFAGTLPGSGTPGGTFPGIPDSSRVPGDSQETTDPEASGGLDDRVGTSSHARSAVTVLQRNRFYAVGGLSQVDCPAPSLASATTRAQRTYDERVFGCLVRAWSDLLGKAGLTTTSPKLFVFDSPGSSPCGSFRPREGTTLAFYCPVNATMYADVRQMARSFPSEHHIAYALVIAHEYGHHLQNVAGILNAESALAYTQPELDMELSRRTEVQASCFAGMFVRSIEASYPLTGTQRRAFAYYATRAFGDSESAPPTERSHGSPPTQGRWIFRGFDANDAARCNSYQAPASDVQ